jgi:alpha-galactosidase
MNRRNFVQLGGTGLLSLIFLKHANALGVTYELVHLPNKVFVKLDDGVHELSSLDKQTWTYKGVTVDLKYINDAIRVSAHSPNDALHHIKLEWSVKTSSYWNVLGDAWERTYGDVHFQHPEANRKYPWYYVAATNGHTFCQGVKTGCNTICYWHIKEVGTQLILDTTTGGVGVKLGDRVLHAADIITTKNKPGENTFYTARRFCGIMCPEARLPAKPIYGINDWYFAYGNNSYDLIVQQTTLMGSLVSDTDNRPFSVVDAGWAAYSPKLPNDCCWQDDFSLPNDKFKDMHKLADNIKALGMRPGLWTRALCASYTTDKKLLAPDIPGRNYPLRPVLDPTILENIEHVKHNISIYKDWGYDMVKHDFSTYDIFGKWGFEMTDGFTVPGWQFNDNTKTNAEIILNLYRSIRESAGDMYIIGCNTMSHLSAGLFEMNRTGDDTSGNEWARTRKMGVNTLGFRMVQHNKFYAADGDCVGLTTKVPWDKNKQWMELLAESSAPLFISAQPDALGAEQKEFIKKCFANAAKTQPVGEPLDWLTHQWPEKWKLDGQVKTFNWD